MQTPNNSNLLTEKEKRIIKKYYILPQFITPCILTAFLITGLWLLLVMINDIGFDGQGIYPVGLFSFLAIEILYLILFSYAMLSPTMGMKGKTWKSIVEKLSVYQNERDFHQEIAASVGAAYIGSQLQDADNQTVSNLGTAMQIAGMANTLYTSSKQAKNLKGRAAAVAIAYGLPLPSIKKCKAMLIILPILLLILIYIPGYVQSYEQKQEKIAVVSSTMATLQDAFESNNYEVQCSDVNASMQTRYWITCDSNKLSGTYISADINTEGMIDKLTYCMDAESQNTPEEYITQFNTFVQESTAILTDTPVTICISDLHNCVPIPDNLIQQYLDHTDNMDFFVSDEIGNVNITFSFNIENSTEYNPPYFYFTIEE